MPAFKSTSAAPNNNLLKPVKTITKHTTPKVKVSSIVKQQAEEEINTLVELKAKVQTLQSQSEEMSEEEMHQAVFHTMGLPYWKRKNEVKGKVKHWVVQEMEDGFTMGQLCWRGKRKTISLDSWMLAQPGSVEDQVTNYIEVNPNHIKPGTKLPKNLISYTCKVCQKRLSTKSYRKHLTLGIKLAGR